MDNVKRACMAAILAVKCGRKSNQNEVVIYDYDQSRYLSFYVNNSSDNNFSMYDYERGNYIQGSLNALFDYVTSTFMSLNINGNNFEGYDYESNSFITGNVSDNTIYIFDYQTSSYYYYAKM